MILSQNFLRNTVNPIFTKWTYFLKINLLTASSLQISTPSLDFMSQVDSTETFIVQGGLTNTQRTADETPTTTLLQVSTQWELHFSVTPTHGNRTLRTSSRQWKALRAEIRLRDKRTCSSCGYLSPHPQGHYMVIDHIDGDAPNNDLSNLRVHCPPCEAIRHCGFTGLRKWISVSESTMEQVEIVRKTREMFENTGVIPLPRSINPSLEPTSISVVELANMMLKTPWKDFLEKFKRLRGFFMRRSSGLFRNTMLAGNPDTYVCYLYLG